MKFFERLPAECPPDEATETQGIYYRLGSIPPDDSDFWSHRRKFPARAFQVSECVAQSLSVFDTLDAAANLRSLLPAMRNKPIFQLNLSQTDGMLMQTGANLAHYSWWRSTTFEIEKILILEK